MAADINVTETAPGEFRVEVSDRGSTSTHDVKIPAGVGIAGAEDVDVVRETFRILLEHQAKEDILPAFDLPMIAQFHADFWSELEARLGGA